MSPGPPAGWPYRFALSAAAMVVAAEVLSRLLMGMSPPILRWHDFSSQLKVDQMDHLASADVVIAGTSMAQQNLVPEVLSTHLDGATVYNAGLNGGVPVVMEPWLGDQVVPRLRPATVVWALSPLDLSAVYGDGTKRAYDDAPQTRAGWLPSVDRAASRYSAVVSSRSVLRDPGKLFGNDRHIRGRRHDEALATLGPAGERLDFRVETGAARQTEMRGRLQPFRVDRDDLAAVARAVEQLESLGVDVIFVELPVPDRFVSLFPRGIEDLELSRSAIAALGVELDVPVIRPTVELDDTDFVDFTHLGQSGARMLSDDVGRQMAAL